MLTYADIQRIFRTEGNTPVLTEVPSDFYSQVSDLTSQVEAEHKQHIEKFSAEICTKRRNKIMLHALRVCEKSNIPTNVTPEEKEFYLKSVDLIQQHSQKTLNINPTKKADQPEKNPEKGMKLRMLKPMPVIVASDMQNYGPFKEDDIIELPESNALVLIRNQFAEEYKEVPAAGDA